MAELTKFNKAVNDLVDSNKRLLNVAIDAAAEFETIAGEIDKIRENVQNVCRAHDMAINADLLKTAKELEIISARTHHNADVIEEALSRKRERQEDEGHDQEVARRKATLQGRMQAAGQFLKNVGFAPGKARGLPPGTIVTPKTLLTYMKHYRKALGVNDGQTSFSPGDVGYIPFDILSNGLVHIEGGIDLDQLKAGTKIKWKTDGCGKTLDTEEADKIYQPAIEKRKEEKKMIVDASKAANEVKDRITEWMKQLRPVQ